MESFGGRLKQERERRKVALDEISVATKIGVRFLRALEEDRFDELPGGIFNKGFVRAYARHLGLDEEQTVADFLQATGASQPAPETPETQVVEILAKKQEERNQARGNGEARVPWGTLAVALLIVACGFALWGSYSERFSQERQERKRSIGRPLAAQSASVRAQAAGSTQAQPKRRETADAGTAIPAATTQAVSSASEVKPAAVLAESSRDAPSAQTSGAASGTFVVSIKAREDSWLSVTADGKEVIQDTLTAAAEKSVEAQREIVVKAGNVGGLDFAFNGQKLPAQGGYDEVKTLIFDPAGLKPAAPPPAAPAPPSQP